MTSTEIKIKLLQAGITSASIAKQQGWTRAYISHIISGRSKNKEARNAVAAAIGCDVKEIWP
jgi:lambda repressor-like predicted transcriptional regulator